MKRDAVGGVIGKVRKGKRPKTVPIAKLDDFNIKNVLYIKIDIEGYEYNAIQGGLNTITRDWPLMVVEQNDMDPDNKASKFLINELGYTHVATCPRGWDYILIKE